MKNRIVTILIKVKIMFGFTSFLYRGASRYSGEMNVANHGLFSSKRRLSFCQLLGSIFVELIRKTHRKSFNSSAASTLIVKVSSRFHVGKTRMKSFLTTNSLFFTSIFFPSNLLSKAETNNIGLPCGEVRMG